MDEACDIEKSKPTLIVSSQQALCVYQSLMHLPPLCHRAPLLSKNTSMSGTLLHWLASSFITINTHTVASLDSIPRTPSCCPKYSQKNQMRIDVPARKVFNKLFPSFWERFVKYWVLSGLRNLQRLFKKMKQCSSIDRTTTTLLFWVLLLPSRNPDFLL